MKRKIGITGQYGFIGWHLYHTLGLDPEAYDRISFERSFFNSEDKLDTFVSQCDVIVHLAALNRHNDPKVIYDTNILLVKKMVASLERTNSNAHVIMSSSSKENNDNEYGKSKKEGRELFLDWANNSKGTFSGLLIPNVFGPFGKPNYNSVVATFCHKITSNDKPEIHVDSTVSLIYINELIQEIIKIIQIGHAVNKMTIAATSHIKSIEDFSFVKFL